MQDENGVNRPVCSYVRVLWAGRLLESPRQAARFVSLLAYEKAPVVGGGGSKQEQWCTLMAFLCRGKVSLLLFSGHKRVWLVMRKVSIKKRLYPALPHTYIMRVSVCVTEKVKESCLMNG